MRHASLSAFLGKAPTTLSPKGPFALVFIEDAAEVDSTIAHCVTQGFREVIAFGAADLLPQDHDSLHLVVTDIHKSGAFAQITNEVIKLFPGVWMHYCFNAEYLFFPFCETRNIRELIAFTLEERRSAMLSYVIDLYSTDLGRHPNAVSREDAHLDRSGYYALARFTEDGAALDREKRAKVGDALRGGISWRCRVAVNSLLRKGYATCQRLPSPNCPIHRVFHPTHSRTFYAMARAS